MTGIEYDGAFRHILKRAIVTSLLILPAVAIAQQSATDFATNICSNLKEIRVSEDQIQQRCRFYGDDHCDKSSVGQLDLDKMQVCQNNISSSLSQYESSLDSYKSELSNPAIFDGEDRRFKQSLEAATDSKDIQRIFMDESARLLHLAEAERKPFAQNPIVGANDVTDSAATATQESVHDSPESAAPENSALQPSTEIAQQPVQVAESAIANANANANMPVQSISTNPQNNNQQPKPPTIEEKITGYALLAVIAICAATILLGMFGQVVFYFDAGDFAWSLTPFAIAVIAGVTTSALGNKDSSGFNASQIATISIGTLMAIPCIGISFRNAIRYNRSVFVGSIVGLCKVFIAALMTFSCLANLSRRGKQDYYANTEHGRRERALAANAFLILGVLWFGLVNGRRVYENRGWTLPK